MYIRSFVIHISMLTESNDKMNDFILTIDFNFCITVYKTSIKKRVINT